MNSKVTTSETFLLVSFLLDLTHYPIQTDIYDSFWLYMFRLIIYPISNKAFIEFSEISCLRQMNNIWCAITGNSLSMGYVAKDRNKTKVVP